MKRKISLYLPSQLQNSSPQQNRPFESFCRPIAEPYSLEYVPGGGVRAGMRSKQTNSKSSIFLWRRVLQLALLLFAFACQRSDQAVENLVLIQIQDRNGLSETISAEERLDGYSKLDFLASQPYKKVLRIYRFEGKNRSVLTTYHPNGLLWQFLEAKEMRACGTYQEWFPNGTKKIEAIVIGGTADLTPSAQESWLFDGISQVWNEEGRLVASIVYEKGILTGTSKTYYASGAVEKETPYFQDQINGEAKEFWENEQIKAVIQYREGLQDGPSLGYYPNGKSCWDEEYKQGYLEKGTYWNFSEEIVSEVKNGAGFRSIFVENRLHQMQEIRKGIIDGLVKTFDNTCELHSIYHVKNGKKHGEEIIYFSRHERELEDRLLPKLSLYWDQDSIHGIVKTWYSNSQQQSQREISRNKRSGTACGWYLDGSLMFLEEYEEDLLLRGQYYKKNHREPISTIAGGNGTAMLYDKDGLFLQKVTYCKSKPQDPE